MPSIETKYGVGDVVFHATITTEKRSHPCPDCRASRKWKAISPAGGEFEVSCPRCSQNYMNNRDLRLHSSWWVPSVRRLTIGSVQANSQPYDGTYGTGNRYMCVETGVGSGWVYDEGDLFRTEEEARAHGEAKARAKNLDATGWVAKQYAGSLKFSDYELKDAAIESANMQRIHMGTRVEMFIDDVRDAESLDDVKRTLERWCEGDDQ